MLAECQLPACTRRPLFNRAVVLSTLLFQIRKLWLPTKNKMLQQILIAHMWYQNRNVYFIHEQWRAYFRPSRSNKLKRFKVEKFDSPISRACYMVPEASEWLTDALRNRRWRNIGRPARSFISTVQAFSTTQPLANNPYTRQIPVRCFLINVHHLAADWSIFHFFVTPASDWINERFPLTYLDSSKLKKKYPMHICVSAPY
jgi:hypothetical protein